MDEKALVCVARIDVTQIFWKTSPDAREDLHVTCKCYCPRHPANYLWEFQFNQPEKIWNPAPTKRFWTHSDDVLRIFHDLLEDPSLHADARHRHQIYCGTFHRMRNGEVKNPSKSLIIERQDRFWMYKKASTIFLPFFFVGVISLFWCIWNRANQRWFTNKLRFSKHLNLFQPVIFSFQCFNFSCIIDLKWHIR